MIILNTSYKKELIPSNQGIFTGDYLLKKKQKTPGATLISRIISFNILNLILLANNFQPHLVPFFQEVYLNIRGIFGSYHDRGEAISI